jgi:hypothetical protein
MKQTTHDINPPAINIASVMSVTARLAQILAQEADLLAEMRIKDITPLQKEKIMLTKAMDLQLQRIQQNPEMLDSITNEEREDMRDLIEIFDEVKMENYNRLLAAKQVNQRVVEAITHAINEQNKKPTYTDEGINDRQFDSLSMTLDKRI